MKKSVNTKVTPSEIVGVKLATGSHTSISLRKQLLDYVAPLLGGMPETRKMARELGIRFNNGQGGTGISQYVGENLVMAATAAAAQKVRKLYPDSVASASLMGSAVKSSSLAAPVVDLNSDAIQGLAEPLEVARQTYAGYTVTWEVMPWSLFQSMPPCAYQRNTEARARRASHLRKESPLHMQVAATRLDGELNMLDSHTRTLLQQNGSLEAPSCVLCLVVHCQTVADVRNFYDQIDNPRASEQPMQKVFGSWRSMNFTPKTEFFALRAKTALQAALFGNIGVRDARTLAEKSLHLVRPLDAIGRGLSNKARPMAVAAGLISVLKLQEMGRPEQIGEIGVFLEGLEQEVFAAHPANGKMDAVGLLVEALKSVPRSGSKAGKEVVLELSLGALHLWLNGPDKLYPQEALVEMDKETFLHAPMKSRRAYVTPRALVESVAHAFVKDATTVTSATVAPEDRFASPEAWLNAVTASTPELSSPAAGLEI